MDGVGGHFIADHLDDGHGFVNDHDGAVGPCDAGRLVGALEVHDDHLVDPTERGQACLEPVGLVAADEARGNGGHAR